MPITRAIEMRTEMTVIERCSLSPRSHPLVDSVSGQSCPIDTRMLGLGCCVLHSIANVFIFAPDNWPALGHSGAARVRRSATGHVRCPPADASCALGSRKLGQVFAEPQRILIGGRRVVVSMRWRSAREHKRDCDIDNGRDLCGAAEQDCQRRQRR
jgi:hypothetical protein